MHPNLKSAALPALAGAFLVAALATGCAVETEPTEIPEQVESSPSAPAAEYLIPLEDLTDMTPEQITEVATISVESVTVNGAIDWSLYAQALTDRIRLWSVAGLGGDEIEDAYLTAESTSDVDVAIAEKYDGPFMAGLAIPSLNLDGWKQTHLAFVTAAYKSYLKDAGEVVRGLSLEGVANIDAATDGSSASFDMTQRSTDNFFSSGAYNADSSKDVGEMGRSTDLDVTYTNHIEAVAIGGNIYLENAE